MSTGVRHCGCVTRCGRSGLRTEQKVSVSSAGPAAEVTNLRGDLAPLCLTMERDTIFHSAEPCSHKSLQFIKYPGDRVRPKETEEIESSDLSQMQSF